MKEKELLALLRLQKTPGVGPISAQKLIRHFGSATAVFDDSKEALLRIPGIGNTLVAHLLDQRFKKMAEEEWDKIQKNGVRCLAFGHPGYPPLLKQCVDAPIILFQKGRISYEQGRMISIVGTRNMTSRGRSFCERFIADLAPFDPVVVSGLAYGVDVCAHRAALNHGLPTVACLAHGLDRIYPETHARYVPEILAHGGLLSEFWMGTPPEPMQFVNRNRIIAGISLATVVIESAEKGGSLITADLAFGYNREVFAVPGRPGDVFSQGCNQLIRDQKAQLVQSAEEFIQAMNWTLDEPPPRTDKKRTFNLEALEETERGIVSFLRDRDDPLLDDIAIACDLPVPEALATLLKLEIQGIVTPLPGKRFQLKV